MDKKLKTIKAVREALIDQFEWNLASTANDTPVLKTRREAFNDAVIILDRYHPWTPTSEGLPEEGQENVLFVPTCTEDGPMFGLFRNGIFKSWDQMAVHPKGITHWRIIDMPNAEEEK